MTIKDIGKFEWERDDEWFEKWYNTQLCFTAFDNKINPLTKLFTPKTLTTLALNARWFFDKEANDLWDNGKAKVTKKGSKFLSNLVTQSEKYVKEAEKILNNLENTRKVDTGIIKEIRKAMLVLWFVFVIDLGEYLGSFIEQKLKLQDLKQKRIEEIKNYYFQPHKSLAFQKEEQNLEKIAVTYRKRYGSKIVSLKDLSSNIFKLLNLHKKKFNWITISDIDSEPFNLADYYNSLKQIIGKELIQKIPVYLNTETKKLLTKKDIIFLELVNRHLFLDNYAADVYAKLDFLMSKLSSEHFSISFSELSWYSFQELETLVEKGIKLKKQDLLKRKQYRVMTQLDGDLGYFYGKHNFEEIKSLVQGNISFAKITKIKGIIASLGIMKGKVKVVKSKKEVNKVKEGDILVAPSTHPDLMPAIRRCAAIVTDTGGITSHAAIISRELSIPCIVGAKNATEILKDDDLVEVDANKGVVTILKN